MWGSKIVLHHGLKMCFYLLFLSIGQRSNQKQGRCRHFQSRSMRDCEFFPEIVQIKMFFFNYMKHAVQWLKKPKQTSQEDGVPDSSHLKMKMSCSPGDSSSNTASTSLTPFNKPLWMRSHSSDLGALLPCNHVLLCMATFVIYHWQPNVRRKQFYLMDAHKRGRGYISFMPHQWIMHNKIP